MNLLQDLIHVVFPEICIGCEKPLTINEKILCVSCRHDLPLTNFTKEKENAVEKSFYGRIPIVKATALFYYSKKGTIQKLIHHLKYKNQQKIGLFFGNWLGELMKESTNYTTIDCIIPVPLHKNKERKRGYNQLTLFGKALEKQLQKPYVDSILVKVSSTTTQTKKLRLDRWKNVEEIFKVTTTEPLKNKHVLLIDDIITTGATLESCYLALQKIEGIKISIACMAYTK